jgi:hypothetical protein
MRILPVASFISNGGVPTGPLRGNRVEPSRPFVRFEDFTSKSHPWICRRFLSGILNFVEKATGGGWKVLEPLVKRQSRIVETLWQLFCYNLV